MYSIVELQTTNNQTAHTYYTAETKDSAMSKYHEVLMYAAISSVEIHVCLVLDEEGQYLARECFKHNQQAVYDNPTEDLSGEAGEVTA